MPLTGMQRFIFSHLILLTACTGAEVEQQPPPASAQQTHPEPAPAFQGLTFEDIPCEMKFPPAECESSPLPDNMVFEYEIVHPLPDSQLWKGASDFQQDDGSVDCQVYQSLKQQLGSDQLRIRSAGVSGNKLQYEAESRGKRYLVEYDLKTVQIVQVLRTDAAD